MKDESFKIRVIGVLGTGTMGHGIAQVAATAGYNVIMMDISEEILSRGLEGIRWSLGKLVEKKRISQEESDTIYKRINVTTRLEEIATKCEFVIEAVSEDFQVKSKVFKEMDELAPTSTVFASNTSTLPITELAHATKRADRFIGTHFFHPPQLMPLVEITGGSRTSKETMQTTVDLMKSFGKEIVICRKDIPGFIVNRILGPLLQEAAWMVYRGEASIIEIDATAKYTVGLPMGLFELADYSGIDVLHRAAVEVGKRDPNNIDLCPLFGEYVERGWYGQKTRKGFYEYKGGPFSRPVIPAELAGKVDPLRLFAPALNAAAWVLREDVTSKEEIERAVRLGLGFPEGLLSMVDKWGIDRVVQVLKEKQERYGDYYAPDPLLSEMLVQGRLGAKVGKGFFDYDTVVREYDEIILKKEPPLAWLILNRPHRLNALTMKTIEELKMALDFLWEDGSVRVLILKGSGDRAFSAGADVTAFGGLSADKASETSRRFQEAFDKLENFPKPTVAAIDGYALGGGCEMALACDFRLASDRSDIGQTEIRLGLMPGAGGTQRLPRIVGEAKAKELIMLGGRVSAMEAEKIGLINKVVTYQKLEEETKAFAMRLAEGPPVALKLCKRAIHMGRQTTGMGFNFEAQAFGTLFSTKDLIEGISAFLSKKKPEFKGE